MQHFSKLALIVLLTACGSKDDDTTDTTDPTDVTDTDTTDTDTTDTDTTDTDTTDTDTTDTNTTPTGTTPTGTTPTNTTPTNTTPTGTTPTGTTPTGTTPTGTTPTGTTTNPLLDTDNDGLTDLEEAYWGTDINNTDSDSDGIFDGDEVNFFGTNPAMADTDGDGLSDYDEVIVWLTNPVATDSDSDALSDYDEIMIWGTNPWSDDSDFDGLSDYNEIYTYGTSATSSDTDLDGLDDFNEVLVYQTNPLSVDSDNDGINDYEETLSGTDPNLADSDLDGLDDLLESQLGTNPLSTDSDGDGLSDGDEVNLYGTNPLLVDSDNDGINDEPELNTYGTNPNLADSDGDLLEDYYEVFTYGTDPNLADTDGDGLTDGDEIYVYASSPTAVDTDNDGLTDGYEVNTFGSLPYAADSDGDGLSDFDEDLYGTDPLIIDTDTDGLSDGEEVFTYNTNPLVIDTDADGLNDYTEAYILLTDPLLSDTDGDGLADGDETSTIGTDPKVADTDGDGLNDGEEHLTHGTSPVLFDTDGDGLNDYVEVMGVSPLTAPTNPLLVDTDGDTLSDYTEAYSDTDPNLADTDGDGIPDNLDIPDEVIDFAFDGDLSNLWGVDATVTSGSVNYITDNFSNIGSALYFDGGLTLNANKPGPSQADATYSFWIKPDGGTGTVFAQRTYCTYEKLLEATVSADTLTVSWMNGSSDWGNPDNYRRQTASTPASLWTHVAVVRDGTEGRMYVNGQLLEVMTIEAEFYADSSNIQIGTGPCGDNYEGALDEFQVHNRVLSDAEIETLAQTPSQSEIINFAFDGDLSNPWGVDATVTSGSVSYITDNFSNVDSALYFDGSLTLNANKSGPSQADATYSFWIKPDGGTGTVFAQRKTCTYEKLLETTVSADTLTVSWMNGSSDWGNPDNYRRQTAPTPASLWTHVAVVREGTVGRMYVNGQLYEVMTIEAEFYADSSNIQVGTGPCGDNYEGALDEFQVHNRALGEAEIELLAQAPDHTFDLVSGLITELNFDGDLTNSAAAVDASSTGGHLFATDQWGSTMSSLLLPSTTDWIDTNIAAPSGDVTYAMWINNNLSAHSSLFSQRETCTYGKFIEASIDDTGEIAVTWMNGDSDWQDSANYRHMYMNVNANEWTHVAVTRVGGQAIGYVNGLPIDIVTVEPEFNPTATTSFKLGYDPCWTNYAGYMDDVLIYNRGLNSTEIAALAAN